MCGVIGQYRLDLIHLIGHSFSQYIQIEHIAGFYEIQVGEHSLGCHAGVPGQHCMGAFTAHRQGTAQQMPNSLLERGIFCAMVNRKTDPDIGDLHIAHDAVSCNVELVFVAFGSTKQHFVVKGILPDTFQHGLIVLDRLFPRCIHGGGVHLLQLLLIGHLDLGLVLFMVAGADDRV